MWIGRGMMALLVAIGLSACRGTDPDTLSIVERIPLPGTFASLHIADDGALWLGNSDGIVRTDPTGVVSGRFPFSSGSAPDRIATTASGLYFRSGSAFHLIDPGTDSLLIHRDDMPGDAVAMDPRGRYLFRTGGAGAILAHDAPSLDPIWGWGAIGAEGTAIAVSPQGDRVYEAITDNDDTGELLVRDLQTGRVLERLDLPHPVRILLAAEDGSLVGIGWRADGSGGTLFRLAWIGGEIGTVWSRSTGDLGISPPMRLRLSGRGDRLAVLAMNDEAGLHVLDMETGRTVDRLGGRADDVAFDPADRIYLLDSSVVLRVE